MHYRALSTGDKSDFELMLHFHKALFELSLNRITATDNNFRGELLANICALNEFCWKCHVQRLAS